MIITSNWKVMNLEGAIRGMRNPLNSWDKSDSMVQYVANEIPCKDQDGNDAVVTITEEEFILGENDKDLAVKLSKAGSSDRKYLRQILVSVDIEAPLFWWKEFDTYKVATVSNSTSTMHKLSTTPITMECFSVEHLDDIGKESFNETVEWCESLRTIYLETKDSNIWRQLIEILPSSWNQKRTITLNYETLWGILYTRENHKLEEWRFFCAEARSNCPYLEDLVYNPICTLKMEKALVKKTLKMAEDINIYKTVFGDINEEIMNNYNEIISNQNTVDENDNINEESTPSKIVVAVRSIN